MGTALLLLVGLFAPANFMSPFIVFVLACSAALPFSISKTSAQS
jgi:hypothetical protein